MEDFIGVLQEAYSEALMGASENYRTADGQKNTTQEGGVKRSDRYNIGPEESLAKQERFYSWDFLTDLEPMKTVMLPEVSDIRGDDNKVNKALVVDFGMKNAEKVGSAVDGKVFVTNSYTGRRIRIDRESIRHSLNGDYRRLLTNSRMGAVIGEIVQRAIPINGRTDTAQNVLGTYSMAIYATDSRGREFVGIITVEERTGKIESLEYYDVAHAVSGRQKNDSQADTKSQGVDPIKAVIISIEDFLSVVKSTHQSILSKSVLQHYGETRNPKGDYANSVLYSDRDPTAAATAQELEKQNAKLRQDVADLRELLSLQGKLTKGTEFKKSSIEAAVKGLTQTAGATLDADGRKQLFDMLKGFYKYIASDENLAWEGVREEAGKIADFLQSNVKFKPQRSEYANDVLKYLRGQRVSLSDTQRAEEESPFMTYEQRSRPLGRLRYDSITF